MKLMNDNIFLILFYFSLFLAFLAFLCLILQRAYYAYKLRVKELLRKSIVNYIAGVNKDSLRGLAVKRSKLFLTELINIAQTLDLNSQIITELREIAASNHKSQRMFMKQVNSFFRYRRIRAAVYLGFLAIPKGREKIEESLLREKDFTVKVYLCNALVEIKKESSIPLIINSLVNAPDWYQKRVHLLLADFGEELLGSINGYLYSEQTEIKKYLIYLGTILINSSLKDYLINASRDDNQEIAVIAIKAMLNFYSDELRADYYLYNLDSTVQNLAIEAMTNTVDLETIKILLPFLRNKQNRDSAVSVINHILSIRPDWLPIIVDHYLEVEDTGVQEGLVNVLADRLEYFLLKLSSKDKEHYVDIIIKIIELGKINTLIGFLNKTKDDNLIQPVLDLLVGILQRREDLKKECCLYLNENVLAKIGLTKLEPEFIIRKNTKEIKKVLTLKIIFAVVLLMPIFIYLLFHLREFQAISLFEHLKIFIGDFNYSLAFYSLAINAIYIILLVFSFFEGYKQKQNFDIKKKAFLFKSGILPSISIIAPAYGEEATIIESANSLMNLSYPDYELIIVNDGSKDQTLNRLIDYFQLEKVDMHFSYPLNTQPVRGLYKNYTFPRLTVVDKANGGKADSLNVGINVASKDYFCGIDADSLLESEALLRVVSTTLDSQAETVAMGGNIFPVNGCMVERGHIVKKNVPKNHLARFQMVEYLRAFMAGRLGWAHFDLLLIISGAFGVFNIKRIIEIGGYLTEKSIFKKDTVGEDMELVIRLTRHMKENNKPYKISYAFNANCWTEVPEKPKIFFRQRDRWQRGLIDILYFHRKLMANPHYGRAGIVGFPYFLIFECIGPLFEAQGYFFVLLALVLGLLNPFIMLFLFSCSVIMGIIISIMAMIIAREDLMQFKVKDLLILIVYAIVENFGFRQFCSIYRVVGYVNAMRLDKGWGVMERKGFKC